MNPYDRIKILLEGLGQASTRRALKSMGRGAINGRPFADKDSDNPNPKKRGNMLPSKTRAGKYSAHMAKQFHRVRTNLKDA